MTFSIVGHCARTGMVGAAVSTAVPAVGAICPYVRGNVGAVSTQSWVNPYLAIDALKRLEEGRSAEEALAEVLAADPGKDLRQIGIVAAEGQSTAWSGAACTPWFGHVAEPHFAAQGNMLVGEATIDVMATAFRRSEALDLAERLMLALEAGEAAGGDKRGRQSAALVVHNAEEYPLLDLRVDEHRHPIAELRRVLTIARLQLLPFVENMPGRTRSSAKLPTAVSAMLLTPPPYRPGGGGSA
jgi:uncharacterized Ntn-hydrolase superfamily protein